MSALWAPEVEAALRGEFREAMPRVEVGRDGDETDRSELRRPGREAAAQPRAEASAKL